MGQEPLQSPAEWNKALQELFSGTAAEHRGVPADASPAPERQDAWCSGRGEKGLRAACGASSTTVDARAFRLRRDCRCSSGLEGIR
eukprot:scaffold1019_cov255-Pinguiococcus_pyrenoidosus.AAC.3